MIREFTAISAAVAALLLAGCGSKSETELIESAKSALLKNDRPAAMIDLKNAIERNPKSALPRYWLGKVLFEGGSPEAAVIELGRAMELDGAGELGMPELARALGAMGEHDKVLVQFAKRKLVDPAANADLQTTLAASYAARSDNVRAWEALEGALGSKPDYAPALVVKARLQGQSGKVDEALALLNTLLTREPGNEQAGLLRAELLLNAKRDPQGAVDAYRATASKNPKSVPAQTALITLLLREGKAAEAKTQFEQLKKAAPNHYDTLFLEAQFAFGEGKFKRSRELADQLFKVLPNSPRVLELAGVAEFSLQQYVQAEFYLGKALKLSPQLLRARQLLAQTYLRLNQPNKAIDVLQPVLDGKAVDATTLSLAGAAWLEIGEDRKAESAFKAAAKAAPQNAGVMAAVALSKAARGSTSAVNDLETLAASDRGTRTDLALISARLSQKDLQGALKAIDGLEKKIPDQPMPHGMRGRVLLLQGDLPGAGKALEKALAKDPAYFPAIVSLAAIDLKNGKADLARQRLEAAVKARPKDYHAYVALADLSVRTGGSADAVLKLLQAAAKANPGEAAPHLALVAQLMAAGRGKEALEAAQVAAGALPNDATITETLARAQMSAGDGNQAAITLKKLTGQYPTNVSYQLLLGDAYLLSKDLDNAQRALRQALALQPGLIEAQRRLVALAIMNKRPQDGLTLAQELQKAEPKNPWGFTLEGEVESSRQRWDAAIAAYRGALQRGANTETAVTLHQALRRAGRSADADLAANDWLKANPKDGVYLYHLANAAMAANRDEEAETRFKAVLELQPGNPLALNNLAWLLVKQGKPGGVALAEKANSLLPGRSVVLDTLAAALAADKQLPKAIEAQLRAVTLSPDDPSLKLNLAKIYLQAGEKSKAQTQLQSLAQLGEKFARQSEVSQLLKSL